MTEPLNTFLIAYWTESKQDFSFLKSNFESSKAIEIVQSQTEPDLLQLVGIRLPQMLIVDFKFQSQLNPLIKSSPIESINKIIISTGETDPPVLNTDNSLPILRINELIYFINTLQSAKRLSTNESLSKNNLYNILVDHVKDLIFFKDVNSRYIMINRSFASHYNKDMISIIGKTDQELFQSNISLISQESDQYVISNMESITFETSYELNKSIFHLETIKTPVISEHNKILGIVGISRDITSKRLQEEQLHRNALLLNQSELLTNSGSFEIKKGESLIQSSSHLRKMLELPGDLPISFDDLMNCIYDADKLIVEEVIKDAFIFKRKNSVNHRVVTSITKRIISCHTTLNIDPNAKTQVIFGTIVDMNEERENQQAILDTQENERKALAANLHDSLIQKLVAANMYLSSLEEGKHDKDKLAIAKDLINSSIDETRRITRNLSLRNVENLGLKNALLEIIESYPLDTEISYHFDFEQSELNNELSTTIYRIFQEAIANIMKYAAANHIGFTIRKSREGLLIRIIDDGIGFTPLQEAQGNGLKNIRLRVAQNNGSFNLITNINEGVEIMIRLPII